MLQAAEKQHRGRVRDGQGDDAGVEALDVSGGGIDLRRMASARTPLIDCVMLIESSIAGLNPSRHIVGPLAERALGGCHRQTINSPGRRTG
jgi:hypothetical protein